MLRAENALARPAVYLNFRAALSHGILGAAEAQKSWSPKYSFCPHTGIIDLSPTSAGRLLIQVVTPWTTFQGAHRIYGLGAGLCHWLNHGQALRPLGVHQVGATSSPGSFLIQHVVVKQVLLTHNCNGKNASSAERFNFYNYSIFTTVPPVS